jgi:hypothetical protein
MLPEYGAGCAHACCRHAGLDLIYMLATLGMAHSEYSHRVTRRAYACLQHEVCRVVGVLLRVRRQVGEYGEHGGVDALEAIVAREDHLLRAHVVSALSTAIAWQA